MGNFDEYDDYPKTDDRGPDRYEEQAVDALRAHFESNRDRVYSSRQIEVEFEGRYFHWITHRALKALEAERVIAIEQRADAPRALYDGTMQRFVTWYERQLPVSEVPTGTR